MKMKVLFLAVLLGLSCQAFGGDPNVPCMIQHYTFDGDLNDSEGSNHGAAMNGGPDFVDGVVNQAAKFYGNRYIDIGPGGYPSVANGGGLDAGSICFWFNSVSTTTDTLLGTANDDSTSLLNILLTGQSLRASIRDDNNATRQVGTDAGALRNGQWYHAAIIYTTGPETEMTIYIDGEPQDLVVQNNGNPETFSPWQYPIFIGMLNNRGAEGNAYTGMLDDLRVYNYALSPIEVATIYTEVRTTESICVIPPEYDFDGDCRVTAVDLSYLLSEWLDCGEVPTCLP